MSGDINKLMGSLRIQEITTELFFITPSRNKKPDIWLCVKGGSHRMFCNAVNHLHWTNIFMKDSHSSIFTCQTHRMLWRRRQMTSLITTDCDASADVGIFATLVTDTSPLSWEKRPIYIFLNTLPTFQSCLFRVVKPPGVPEGLSFLRMGYWFVNNTHCSQIHIVLLILTTVIAAAEIRQAKHSTGQQKTIFEA